MAHIKKVLVQDGRISESFLRRSQKGLEIVFVK